MYVCPGPCSHQWRKAEKEKAERGTPHDLEPRYGQPVWCETCTRSVRLALYCLPRDAAYVLLEIENGTSAKKERVSGTPSRSLHAKEGLARIIEEISGTLGDWEDDVREARTFTGRRPRRQGPQIEYSTRFLLSNFLWLMQEHDPEASRAFGWEIGTLHRKAQKATHAFDAPAKRCVGVRCPGCGWKSLVWEVRDGEASGYVLCEHCERLLTEKEYRVQVKSSMLHVRFR